jgi:hypothetical protein
MADKKIYMASVKNDKGEFVPEAIGSFAELLPLGFGRVMKLECLGTSVNAEAGK